MQNPLHNLCLSQVQLSMSLKGPGRYQGQLPIEGTDRTPWEGRAPRGIMLCLQCLAQH